MLISFICSSSFKMASQGTPSGRRSISNSGLSSTDVAVSRIWLPVVSTLFSLSLFCTEVPCILFLDARWSTLRVLLLRMPTTPMSHPWCRCWQSLESCSISVLRNCLVEAICQQKVVFDCCVRFRVPQIAILENVHDTISPNRQHLARVSNCCGGASSMVLMDRHWVLLHLDFPQGVRGVMRWSVFPPCFVFLLQWVLFQGWSRCWKNNNLHGIQTLSNCME